MHIAEGVLSPGILMGSAALTMLGTALGLKRLDPEKLLVTGVLASFFFIASLIHVPIGLSSAHLIGNGLVGILLGWGAFPAILVALFLQAVLFQYGGITVLGVNCLTMATGAVIAHFSFILLWRLFPGSRGLRCAAFIAALLALLSSLLFTSLSLAMTDEGFFAAALAYHNKLFPELHDF